MDPFTHMIDHFSKKRKTYNQNLSWYASVIEIWLTDSSDLAALTLSTCCCMSCSLLLPLPIKYAGFEGIERMRELLLSMSATEAMVGLSTTFS
jgi:hypothetical protein